jgi:hypothetical protein
MVIVQSAGFIAALLPQYAGSFRSEFRISAQRYVAMMARSALTIAIDLER